MLKIQYGFASLFLVVMITASLAVKQPNDNSNLADHNTDGEHNVEYDHQAFLGGEKAAKAFEELTESESKKKLAKILQRIDKNNDSYVSTDEMVNWLIESFKKIDRDESAEIFEMQDKNQDSMVSWDEYLQFVFGFVPGEDHKPEYSYQKEITRNEKRFKSSDLNGDGALNKEEYLPFHNPRIADHMKDIVIEQVLLDLDYNNNEGVDLEEFLGDYYKPSDGNLPDWVKQETDLFKTILDADKDGILKGDEIYAWVSPKYKDNAVDEALHLLKEADDDQDGMLSMEEVLNHYEVFAGSHVTHYGQSLSGNSLLHEEL
ncbi:calumenin-B-like isoform X2 [Anneissia japonica]|nr:calumenin-B-like isoform X2 [Anneissia japonica]XP_033119968.1 calumenin-B-like isoform X2 [Anneissia japonica]